MASKVFFVRTLGFCEVSTENKKGAIYLFKKRPNPTPLN